MVGQSEVITSLDLSLERPLYKGDTYMKIGDVVYAYDFSSDKVYEATIIDIAD